MVFDSKMFETMGDGEGAERVVMPLAAYSLFVAEKAITRI